MASYASTPEVFKKVVDVFSALGEPVVFAFGKHRIPEASDPSMGHVVIVPTTAAFAPPQEVGGNPRMVLAVKQSLEVHCYARACKQQDPGKQYAADFAQAEILRNKVLAVMDKWIPGVRNGGTGETLDPGANVWGVELVATVTVDIDAFDAALALAPEDTVFEESCSMVTEAHEECACN